MPTARPEVSAALRTARYTRLWSARSPWLKFSRAMSIPASTSRATCSSLEVAGPSVQTIFARRPAGHRSVPQCVAVRGGTVVADQPIVGSHGSPPRCTPAG